MVPTGQRVAGAQALDAALEESAVPLPPGYHSVNPYFLVTNVKGFIDFLVEVLEGMEVGEREIRDDGAIDHADVMIGDSLIMMSEASESTRRARASTSPTWTTSMQRSAEHWPRARARSWSRPSSRGAIGSPESSTRSTTAGGSRRIYARSAERVPISPFPIAEPQPAQRGHCLSASESRITTRRQGVVWL